MMSLLREKRMQKRPSLSSSLPMILCVTWCKRGSGLIGGLMGFDKRPAKHGALEQLEK